MYEPNIFPKLSSCKIIWAASKSAGVYVLLPPASVLLAFLLNTCSGLYYQHLGYRSRQISVSSRTAGIQSEFQDSQGYTEIPCLKKTKTKTKTCSKVAGESHAAFTSYELFYWCLSIRFFFQKNTLLSIASTASPSLPFTHNFKTALFQFPFLKLYRRHQVLSHDRK